MAKILTTDGGTPTELPAPGTHAVYTKADLPGVSGLYIMDSTGVEVGPLSTGGGPPGGPAGGVLTGTYPNPGLGTGVVGPVNIAPLAVGTTELADNSVTNLKMADNAIDTLELVNSSVQTAKIALGAVNTARIALGAVTADRLAMSEVPYGFILSDSVGGDWAGGLPPRIKFAFPSRLSILGDIGGVSDPVFPRLVDSSGPDVDIGYLSKALSFYIKLPPAGGDLNLLTTRPTVFELDVSGAVTVYLPDSRAYPPGTVLTFVQTSTGVVVVGKTSAFVAGGFGDIKETLPNIPAADQLILPGQTKKFITFGGAGGGWWVSREVFSRIKNISIANGVAEANTGTGAVHWGQNPASSSPWLAITAQRLLLFPVDSPDGAILTGVDVLLAHSGAVPATRMKVHLYREDLNYAAPAAASTLVATAIALGNLLVQKVSLTGLAELIYSSGSGVSPQSSWTVAVESSTGVPAPTQNTVFGVRLTYTL